MTKNEILRHIRNRVLSIYPNAEIYLYGSRARGDFSSDSDWDILILTNVKLPYQLRNKIEDSLYDFAIDNDLIISVLIYAKETWQKLRYSAFYQNVKQEALCL